ncbi:MAG: penicillin-binding transpeptidase domain-containing protein [Lachnospiraceae bacterium]|nr:penicillin-binding transpeptidase domain-containing protein [Lachnospiraceae bacterium]
MKTNKKHRTGIKIYAVIAMSLLVLLIVRLTYVTIFCSDELNAAATMLHERERAVKAPRGRIITADGTVMADNKTVCTVSVIHSQIEDEEYVIDTLSRELDMSEDKVRSYVEKISSMERIKSNVSKETGDRIREYNIPGVKVDEDSKRTYPHNELASKVMGFTGADNQGIVGLEVKYDSLLAGVNGEILTLADAAGIELDDYEEKRKDPIPGNDLYISLDYNIQSYCMQAAMKTYEAKQAKSVSIIVMNPQTGELLAMVNYPEYNLNDPYTLNYDIQVSDEKEKMELLNAMWRNGVINDTYEPGSTFKVITATAGLSCGAVSLSDTYCCGGSTVVGSRTIRCHKTTGHGTQTFAQTLMNSCNPAFITWGLRTGVDNFLTYMDRLGLMSVTGVDLPGEASTIMHKKENIKELELATMSFGQSFQITPLQLMRAISCVVNGGTLITPHFGVRTIDSQGNINTLEYETTSGVITEDVSNTMKMLLKSVVSEGGGGKCYIEGYSIGGKTATSQKLPRSEHKYIASFIGFAPAENPQVMAMCIIDEPQGIYYGGTIAAPVVREVFENILPYLGIEQSEKGTQ